LELLP